MGQAENKNVSMSNPHLCHSRPNLARHTAIKHLFDEYKSTQVFSMGSSFQSGECERCVNGVCALWQTDALAEV